MPLYSLGSFAWMGLLNTTTTQFATDILLMINWSIADQWLIKYQWMPQKFGCHLLMLLWDKRGNGHNLAWAAVLMSLVWQYVVKILLDFLFLFFFSFFLLLFTFLFSHLIFYLIWWTFLDFINVFGCFDINWLFVILFLTVLFIFIFMLPFHPPIITKADFLSRLNWVQ